MQSERPNHMRRIDTLDDIAEGLEALLQTHPELGAIATRAGPLPLRRSEPGFESLASVIVSQQVSKASAAFDLEPAGQSH